MRVFTLSAMGSKPSKPINPASPLGCLLEALKPQALMPYLQIPTLVHLCSKKWPRYNLDNNLKWLPNGTFDPDILQELSNYCQHTGKWKKFPYIQTFFYLSSKPKPSVLASYSPAHMFLAMPSEPEEHSTSALDPANKPPPFQPQRAATSAPSAPALDPTKEPTPSQPQQTDTAADSLPAAPPPSALTCAVQASLPSSALRPPPTNYVISPVGSFLLSSAWPQQPPGSGTHLYPSTHMLTCCCGTQP